MNVIGVGIVDFKPENYSNGSRVISLQDIGELRTDFSNSEDVLVCITDRKPCCLTQPYRFGYWIYNGTSIGSRGYSGMDYFRSRDNNNKIYLSLRTLRTSIPPTGNFCCVLPDANDVSQTKCLIIGNCDKNILHLCL